MATLKKNILNRNNKASPLQASFRDNSYQTPLIKERLEKGLLTPREVDKLFAPSKHEIDSILKVSSSGFAGVIISLDTALVDIRQICGYSYALLAGELSQPTPNPKKVYDSLGSTFKTCITSFGWDIDTTNNLGAYENRYYEIFEKLLNMMPIEAHFGAVPLINELIRNNDEITVISAFPRSVAINILKKANLSPVFENRVPAEHLVCRDDTEQIGEGYSGQRIIQCCGLMRSPTMLAIYIDANRRNALAAKRDGLGVIALQGVHTYFSKLIQIIAVTSKITLKITTIIIMQAMRRTHLN